MGVDIDLTVIMLSAFAARSVAREEGFVEKKKAQKVAPKKNKDIDNREGK